MSISFPVAAAGYCWTKGTTLRVRHKPARQSSKCHRQPDILRRLRRPRTFVSG